MNELQVFNNEEFKIQIMTIDNEPWFVGKEVAKLLGYQNGSRDINRHVDEDDRRYYRIGTTSGTQKSTIINESGLYSLILSSKLSSAKRFKKWVTSEVLPKIRQTGNYSLPQISYADSLRLLASEIEKNEKLQIENKMHVQQIAELKPKADYYDRILNCKALMTITQIAKDYGMSGKTFNAILHDLGVQYRQSDQWFLYSRYQDKGYTSSETIEIPKSDGTTFLKLSTKWTQKGRVFLYELLKKHDYLPVIEQY